jgi:hypothetical protein
MPIHNNYEKISNDLRGHVDEMYKLVSKYAKENNIPLFYDDRAEEFVEAIATYVLEGSLSEIKKNIG